MNRTSRDPRDTRTVRTSFRKYMGRYWQLYAIMLVPVCYFLLFKYVPMLGNILAFRRFKPLTGPYGVSWAQPPLRYFRQFMGQEGFWQAFRSSMGIQIPDEEKDDASSISEELKEGDEIVLPVTAGGVLPCGASGRWSHES